MLVCLSHIQPLVVAKCVIVYLDTAKHVPWLGIALQQLCLKSCAKKI